MKILITGGSGYIGSLLIPKLLEEDHEVVLYDIFSFGMRSILHCASHKNLSIVEGDVRDAKMLKSAMEDVDLVVHLAAIVGYPACAKDPHLATTINVEGTRNVVENLAKGQRMIFSSTGSTYGKVDGICDENTPIAPLTLYGSTKAEAEKLVTDAGGVALRFATVFGISPRLRLDLLINDFIYQAIHNKQIVLFESGFRRTFLHVSDAVRSIEFAIANYDKMSGEPFNVGDDSMNFTKKDVAMRIKEKVEYYLHEADFGTDLDKRDYEVSYKKIRSLGFQALVDMDEGMDEIIKVLRHLRVTNEWRNA